MADIRTDGEGQLFRVAAAGDVRAACEIITRLAERESPQSLLTALAAVQIEVGDRWAANQLTIADEHRASAVIDAALAVVERHLPPADEERGRITLVCAETEWHTLPARFAATWLRLGGWTVDFLGGSLPAAVLADDLARRRPDVVAVSCSVPDQLFGARRTVAAAHQVDLPVVAGGAAFGADDRRARAIGASAWAAGGTQVAAAADRARAVGPTPDVDPQLELRALEVVAHQDRLVAAAGDRLRQRFPAFLQPNTAAEARTLADLRSIVRFAAASLLVEDLKLFDEFIDWLVSVLVVRGVPVASLEAGLRALVEAEPPEVVVPVLMAGRARVPSSA